MSSSNDIEILTTDLRKVMVSSMYKPPCKKFIFTKLDHFKDKMTKIITGDFNSHSRELGIPRTNENGKKVENTLLAAAGGRYSLTNISCDITHIVKH